VRVNAQNVLGHFDRNIGEEHAYSSYIFSVNITKILDENALKESVQNALQYAGLFTMKTHKMLSWNLDVNTIFKKR